MYDTGHKHREVLQGTTRRNPDLSEEGWEMSERGCGSDAQPGFAAKARCVKSDPSFPSAPAFSIARGRRKLESLRSGTEGLPGRARQGSPFCGLSVWNGFPFLKIHTVDTKH